MPVQLSLTWLLKYNGSCTVLSAPASLAARWWVDENTRVEVLITIDILTGFLVANIRHLRPFRSRFSGWIGGVGQLVSL